MKLITPEFIETMKDYPLGSQEDEANPLIVAKFFDPCGSGTWYILEYDPEENLAFGFVTGLKNDELGFIELKEIESIVRPGGLTIERDLYWKPKPLSEIKGAESHI